jgi:hypothetical protein
MEKKRSQPKQLRWSDWSMMETAQRALGASIGSCHSLTLQFSQLKRRLLLEGALDPKEKSDGA